MLKTLVPVLLLAAALGLAQPAAPPQPLTDAQAQTLIDRSLQLSEAAGFASPELGRASAPLLENMKQAVESTKFLGTRSPRPVYVFMMNLRAFLLVSDTVPKPVEFPAVARQQLTELRENLVKLELYFQQLTEQLQTELRSGDRDNLKRYREANTATPAPDAKKPRVVFFGDSITDFWRLKEYFAERDFVNRGISGQVTSQMLGRFLADVVQLKPAAVLILAGTNDIARGTDPQTIENNLTMICDLADTYKVKVILASLLPVSDYHKSVNPGFERTKMRPPAVILEVNRWMAAFAARRGYAYLDYHKSMVDQAGQLISEMADDGLHPNPAGYRVMAPLALEAIDKALNVQAQPAGKKWRLF